MPTFNYVALDEKQNTVKGTVEQPDKAAAISTIVKQGLRPISIKEVGSVSANVKTKKMSNMTIGPTRVKSKHLVIFTREMSAMISAGVPLLKTLNSLAQHTESKGLRKVLGEVVDKIEGGATLADALAKHPKIFDEIYVNMVRAGESAGILDDILTRLAYQQEKNASIKRRIRGAMIYPVTLLFITTISFFVLMIWIVPQLSNILKDLGGPDAELPYITKFMLGVSSFVQSYVLYIAITLVGLLVAWFQFIKTNLGKQFWHRILIITPGLKKVAVKMVVSRFTRTFSALMGAGVSVIECLRISSKSVGNVHYQAALEKAALEVKNGRQLSAVIDQNPLFPSIVSEMLAVGEETGATETVLVKVADFYEEEVDVAISGLSSIIEPVMIIIMGGLVGLIAASVMLPITSLSQNVK